MIFHFGLFLVLGGISAEWLKINKSRYRYLDYTVVCASVALIAEVGQVLVPGRSFIVIDLIVNLIAVVLVLWMTEVLNDSVIPVFSSVLSGVLLIGIGGFTTLQGNVLYRIWLSWRSPINLPITTGVFFTLLGFLGIRQLLKDPFPGTVRLLLLMLFPLGAYGRHLPMTLLLGIGLLSIIFLSVKQWNSRSLISFLLLFPVYLTWALHPFIQPASILDHFGGIIVLSWTAIWIVAPLLHKWITPLIPLINHQASHTPTVPK
ncbi:MAG: VanZ family protein [bacterium]